MTKGYVAPNPTFCERVADMMKQMREGLKERGILPEELEDKMAQLEDLATTFKVISDKELKGKSLTEEEYRRIWEIGDELESIISFSDEIKAKVSSEADTRMAIIADVHTENNTKQVLEEGVGDPFSLYAVVEIEGGYQLLKGAIFSYYEFKHPMKDRLTDEKWQKMLEEEKAPELPEWTTIYMENGE
jgi:hypothetical protein